MFFHSPPSAPIPFMIGKLLLYIVLASRLHVHGDTAPTSLAKLKRSFEKQKVTTTENENCGLLSPTAGVLSFRADY